MRENATAREKAVPASSVKGGEEDAMVAEAIFSEGGGRVSAMVSGVE